MSPSVPRSQIASTVPIAVTANPLLALSRREKAIQAELQLLLDAQSVGLVQGRVGDSHGDDRSSDAGSSTPTTRSMAPSPNRSREHRIGSVNRGVIPVRQPRRKKIGLKGARRGILSAMEELLAVKEHEGVVVDEEINTLNSLLSRVNMWEKKISSFEQEMKRISDGTEGREIGELKTEKSAVETEIRELEERLMNLRARERHLSRRIEEVRNRTESEISSFREGRRGVESEIKEFLRRPPVLEVAIAVITRQADGVSEGEGFLSLPPKRRTLEMARDWLSSTLATLSTHRDATEKEKGALEQGATMWNDTIALVMTFEEDLRVQINGGQQLAVQDLEKQLTRMQTIVRDLEGKARGAEEKRWNLLICAIGAELEAFREGEGLLRGVLATLHPSYASDTPNRNIPQLNSQTSNGVGSAEEEYLKNSNGNQSSIDNYDDAREELVGLQRDDSGNMDVGSRLGQAAEKPGMGLRRMNSSPYRSETESEDDGPPQALLVGVQDEDDG
jgi:molecular chaperone GrpE (heat shock protein)